MRVPSCSSLPDGTGQVLEIDLVADAGARRDYPEVVEGELPPAQKGIALPVAFHLLLDVDLESLGVGIAVDHHRVVDDQIDGNLRIDPLRIAAGAPDRVAHRRQVDHRRHPGKILHQHPRRREGDLVVRFAGLLPIGQGADVIDRHRRAILGAQQVLEQHLEGERQAGNVPQAGSGRGRQAEIVVANAPCLQAAPGVETVLAGHHHEQPPPGR